MSTTKNQPIGKWKASVHFKHKGKGVTSRKVKTTGLEIIRVGDKLANHIVNALRSGKEVHFRHHKYGDMIRLYNCLDTNLTTMFVSSQTMGDFRRVTNDIDFELVDAKGKPRDNDACFDRVIEGRKANREMICVSPDTVVTCPNCQTVIRVGKILSSKASEEK